MEAEEGDVGQDHRNEDQESRNADADQRVGRANGTTTDLTGLGNNGVLELVEGRICGGAELLSGSSKLLTGGLTRLTLRGLAILRLTLGSLAILRLTLGSLAILRLTLRGLAVLRLTLGSLPVLRLTLRGLAILRLTLGSLPVLRLTLGSLAILRLRGGGLTIGCEFGGRLLTRTLGNRALELLVRHRGGVGGGVLAEDRCRVGRGSRLLLLNGLVDSRALLGYGLINSRDLCGHSLINGLGLVGHSLLGGRRLRGDDTLVGQPLPKRRVQRRVGRNVGAQVGTRGRDIGEVLSGQCRITHVSSAELRRVDSAHLYSSRTRKCSS